MDYMVVISAVVLGLSVLATLAKFLDWFLHSDPRTMVRTTRWMLLLALLACLPLLGILIAGRQWAAAMLVGAVVLIVPTVLKWRSVVGPLRGFLDGMRPRPRPFDMEVWPDDPGDPETVRRAASVLEAYLSRQSLLALRDERTAGRGEAMPPAMPRGEALEVLGLEPGADEVEIRAAHKRLLRLVHPDRGGSAWLAAKVYEARDTLLTDLHAPAAGRDADERR
ncbi:hypothetical protein [Reyranella sp.]|uniref:hypothetical protein n=1 Tax=Reyranella sp. TaxID=1929291 RepID=UPI003BABE2B7